MKMSELCHCGRPLHYSDKQVEAYIRCLVKEKGRYVAITLTDTMKTYKVDRHYIELHGVAGKDLESLGFEEMKNGS